MFAGLLYSIARLAQALDLTRDAADWAALDDTERDFLLRRLALRCRAAWPSGIGASEPTSSRGRAPRWSSRRREPRPRSPSAHLVVHVVDNRQNPSTLNTAAGVLN